MFPKQLFRLRTITWAWGLHWEPDEPARFRAAFACAVVFVAVLLVPALRRLVFSAQIAPGCPRHARAPQHPIVSAPKLRRAVRT